MNNEIESGMPKFKGRNSDLLVEFNRPGTSGNFRINSWGTKIIMIRSASGLKYSRTEYKNCVHETVTRKNREVKFHEENYYQPS